MQTMRAAKRLALGGIVAVGLVFGSLSPAGVSAQEEGVQAESHGWSIRGRVEASLSHDPDRNRFTLYGAGKGFPAASSLTVEYRLYGYTGREGQKDRAGNIIQPTQLYHNQRRCINASDCALSERYSGPGTHSYLYYQLHVTASLRGMVRQGRFFVSRTWTKTGWASVYPNPPQH